MTIRTQIGGKYSVDNTLLFPLKEQIEKAGVGVAHPIGNMIKTAHNGISLAYDPDVVGLNPFEVETDYYQNIRQNPFHVVCNMTQNTIGYVGESAAIEMAYAMVHSKPIVLMFPPIFGDSVDSDVKAIICRNSHHLLISRLDLISEKEVLAFFNSLVASVPSYALDIVEEIGILNKVDTVIKRFV